MKTFKNVDHQMENGFLTYLYTKLLILLIFGVKKLQQQSFIKITPPLKYISTSYK